MLYEVITLVEDLDQHAGRLQASQQRQVRCGFGMPCPRQHARTEYPVVRKQPETVNLGDQARKQIERFAIRLREPVVSYNFV